MDITNTTQHHDHTVYVFADNTIVCVGQHNVWIEERPTPGPMGPSGVDYYYDTERGYNCATPEEVARQYYQNFILCR